jgi:ribonuclease-3
VDYGILLTKLQQRLGYTFANEELLRKALTHKSFANEQLREPAACNERQEFLGDAVLDLVTADFLYNRYPQLPEGELSRIRAELVSATALAEVARGLHLGNCLLLGRGERRSGGHDKDNLLANALEAVFGAIFLDAGWAAVRKVLVALFENTAIQVAARESQDFKTRLQELAQAQYGHAPTYELTDVSGPDHQRQYSVVVFCDGKALGEGVGSSKKSAQQQAACLALQSFEPVNEINQ